MKKKGLTLAETILASCLLGLVVLAMFNLLPGSLLAMRQAEHKLRAAELSHELLESFRQRPYEELTTGIYGPIPAEQEAGVTFQPTLQVYNVPGADPDMLKRVRVVVQWQFRGEDRQFSDQIYRVHVRKS